MYWDIDATLSHNCLFNMIVGSRGVGKTYGAKKKAVKRFLKSGDEFIYLRRYKTELQDIKTFWTDIIINEEFPDLELKTEGLKFKAGDKIIGHALALSTAKIKKSVAYPKVSMIIFDEYIIEKGVYHYLPDEVTAFLEFYLTVSRYRPVIVLFMANSITMNNPYHLHFNLALPYNSQFMKRDDCLLQLVDSPEFTEHVKQTRVGKLLASLDNEYMQYAADNNFKLDNKNFVEKRSPAARHYFNIFYKGTTYGIWMDWAEGLVYFSEAYDPMNQVTYSITTSDHRANMLLIKNLKHSHAFTLFVDAFKLGKVRFENIKIKAVCFDIFRLTHHLT